MPNAVEASPPESVDTVRQLFYDAFKGSRILFLSWCTMWYKGKFLMNALPVKKSLLLKKSLFPLIIVLMVAALMPHETFAQSFFWIRCQTSPSDICYTDGNVGIGTLNPQARLEVLGVLEVHNGTGAATTSKIRFDDSDSASFEDSFIFDDAFVGSDSAFIFRQDGNDRLILQNGHMELFGNIELHGANSGDKGLFFDTRQGIDDGIIFDDGVSGFESGITFRQDGVDEIIFQNGKVGIGTLTPNSMLEVDGYVELDRSNGFPPAADCDSPDEIGRMKVDSTRPFLYICFANGWARK